MSSPSLYHSGLIFATLVIQFVKANGGVISRLEPRRRGGENGEDPDDGAPATSQPPPSPSTPSPSPSKANITSVANTSSTSSISQSSASLSQTSSAGLASLSSTSDGSSTSATTSISSAPTALAGVSASRSVMPTPVIVGSVVGAVVLGGVLVLLLIICCRRVRKAKKDPDAPLPVLFFSRSPRRTETPQTNPEMSQTQSSPLIAPAIASGLISNPFMIRYSRSFNSSNSSPASSSPLVPASNLPGHSNSVTSSSGRSTSHTTATSDLEILQPPRGSPVMSSPSTLLPIITAVAEAAARASPPASEEMSPLHRSLTMHQKALETDEKGQDEGRMDIDQIQGMNDPPPEYDA